MNEVRVHDTGGLADAGYLKARSRGVLYLDVDGCARYVADGKVFLRSKDLSEKTLRIAP